MILPLLIAALIQTERLSDTIYKLTLPAAASAEAGRMALAPKSAQLCGSGAAIFGSFKIRDDGALEQELFCGGTRVSTPPPAGQADAADQQAALAASYAYFAAKDSRRYAAAHALLSPRLTALSPFAQWQADAAEFNRAAGAVRGRQVAALTWYVDPADAPAPGTYVAADYSGDFANLEWVCGYLMWHVQPDGSYRLVREEQNMLDKETAKRVSKLDRAQLRARMGCKD